MSNWYRATVVSRIKSFGKHQQSEDVVFKALAKARPALAARLRALNWHEIISFVANEALKKVADQVGGTISKTPGAIEVPSGASLIGVISSGRDRLGVVIKNKVLSFVWRSSGEKMSVGQEKLVSAFEQTYREQVIKAAIRIVSSGDVQTRENKDAVMFTAELRETV